jgi:hypothetical protein
VALSTSTTRGTDSAVVQFAETVDPNANGRALGAAEDSVRFLAALRRSGGAWRMVGTPAPVRDSAATSSAPRGR